MKDNLVTVDVCDPRGRLQQKNKRFRLIGGQLVPGEKLTIRKDVYGASNRAVRFLARCLKTGTLLVEIA